MPELTLDDTNGILRRPWVSPERTSRGLGWEQLYLSTQRELPYRASFGSAWARSPLCTDLGVFSVGHRLRLTDDAPPGRS